MLYRNKVAFITGGASGIGLAVGKALAKEGARVILADIDSAALKQSAAELAGDVSTQTLDVRDRDAWQQARENALSTYGHVDFLMNNAGIINDSGGPIEKRGLVDQTFDSFDRMIAINLTGVFNGIATFGPDMRERRTGHIINTASSQGLITCRGVGSYSAGKYGVVALSECLYDELHEYGVAVSVLCPGVVATRLSETSSVIAGESAVNKMPGGYGMNADAVAQRVLKAIEDRRLYIHTHGEYAKYVNARHERIMADFSDVPVSDMYSPNVHPPGTREWANSGN